LAPAAARPAVKRAAEASTYNTEPNGVVPDDMRYPNCKPDFSPQERILEYLVFEIASCVGPQVQ
jgi:hypothetical protein